MIKMPPQAYTKEVLAAAFDWLAQQPEYVRQKISSSDDLVGLYLKSTRLKSDFNKDLTSAKNFRNELQDLAQNLKQFEEKEEPRVATPTPTPTPLSPAPKTISVPTKLEEAAMIAEAEFNGNAQRMTSAAMVPAANPTRPTTVSATPAPSSTTAPTATTEAPKAAVAASEGEVIFKLDEKTLSALNLAKDKLNLSSDTEALRVLVSLGEKHLKKLFASED